MQEIVVPQLQLHCFLTQNPGKQGTGALGGEIALDLAQVSLKYVLD